MCPTHHRPPANADRKSTRLNSSHVEISYAVFCLKKKKTSLYVLHVETAFAGFCFKKKLFTGGGQAGYNCQTGAFVLGVETDFDVFSFFFKDKAPAKISPFPLLTRLPF